MGSFKTNAHHSPLAYNVGLWDLRVAREDFRLQPWIPRLCPVKLFPYYYGLQWFQYFFYATRNPSYFVKT